MSILSARRKAAHRKRRILYNNDGGDVQEPESATPEGFLGLRTTVLNDTHVDTVLYCTHLSFNMCRHNTKIGEITAPAPPHMPVNNAMKLIRSGRDCLELIVDYSRSHGMEAFWSMRMNDVHDGALPETRSRFKIEHPEYLVGIEGDYDDSFIGEPRWWTALNYERPEVRTRALELIREVGSEYNVDGIELDFYRHPIYFARNRKGLAAEPSQAALITDFMRSVRKTLDEIIESRDRPLLLAVRLPDAVWNCMHIGLDIETWLKEELIDVLIVGGYYHLTSWKEMIELGHANDVPVYPCISATRLRARVAVPLDEEERLWRGEAVNILGAGGDGVYLFNHFVTRGSAVLNIGETNEILRQPRIYAPNPGHVEKFLGKSMQEKLGLLPVKTEKGTIVVEVPVFERLKKIKNRELKLYVRVSDHLQGPLYVRVNGNPVVLTGKRPPGLHSFADGLGLPGTWWEGPLETGHLKYGLNSVTISSSEVRPAGDHSAEDSIRQNFETQDVQIAVV